MAIYMRSVLFLAAAMLVGCASATTSTVYIIRHGEKTWALGCLNDVGKERAATLPSVFNGKSSPLHDTFLAPQALFANQYDDPIDCERCKQTLEPISSYLNLTIDFNHGYPRKLGGNDGAAHAIINATGGASVILVAWEHHNIQYLAADLGVPKAHIPVWPDSDYDTVYKLELHGGALVNFSTSKQNFHPSASMSTAAAVARKPATYKVAVVVAPGFYLIDALGPLDTFRCAQKKCFADVNLTSHQWRPGRPGGIVADAALSVSLLADSIDPVKASSGVVVTPDAAIDLAAPYDLVVIPAGADTPAIRELVQRTYAAGGSLMSVCTGASVLASLGLLDGRSATTNSLVLWRLERDYPNVRWRSLRDQIDKRFIISEAPLRIMTTAGVTAGTDGALHFLSTWLGDDVAEAVREFVEWPLALE